MQMRRRSFIAGMAAAGGGLSAQPSSRTARHPVRLGGPIYLKSDDPEELAEEHIRLGYKAAYCPQVSLQDKTRMDALSRAFSARRVTIAEVGKWVNLLDPDPVKRQENLQTVTDGLALADAIGALCCVDIAGSFSTTSWFGPHPENLSRRFFDAAVENARKIIDAVKPRRAKFCYEMMGWSLPDSADSALELVEAVDRRAFAVHLDPCNLINCPSRFYANTELLHECFDKLGGLIVSCHAKDLVWNVEMNVHFKEVRPGLGSLDYRTYLTRLAELPHQPPLMLEHLSTAEEYEQGYDYIVSVGKKAGIGFAIGKDQAAGTKSVRWDVDNLQTIGGHRPRVLGNPEVIREAGIRALAFDGTGDGLILQTNPLAGARRFTIEVIFRPDRDGAEAQRFLHMQQNEDHRVLVETRLNNRNEWFLDTFIKCGSDERTLQSTGNLHPLGRWYHAALTYDGRYMRHYVNGVEEMSGEVEYEPVSGGQTSIGCRLNQVYWFKGVIRTVRVTPSVLQPGQFLAR